MLRRLAAVALGSLCLCACSDSSQVDTSPQGDPKCDNLSEEHCVFPFPSDHFLAETDDGPSVQFRGALPQSVIDIPFDDSTLESYDGWPIITPIQLRLPGATLAGAAPVDDIAQSLEPGSKTLVLDAETGERMPHWVELDHFSEDAGTPVIVLRLARALEYQRRYVVVVRGLVDEAGQAVAAPRGFAALRDGTETPVVGIEERRARFDQEVFPVAEAAGVARGEIQLAWDFTTNSEENTTGDLVAMRDRVLSLVGDAGPDYTIDEVEVFDPADEPNIAIRLVGTAQVPSFALPPDSQGIRRLRRDAEGLPVAEGFEEVEFTVQFPRSVVEGGQPAAVLQYGHGFLYNKDEADTGWLRAFANDRGFLIVASDMQGLNTEAGALWFSLFARDLSPFPKLSELPHQGVINHVAIMRMMKGAFFADTDPRYTNAGTPWYDPSRMYYYGNSQGGTTGNIIVSLHVDVQRGVLGVPGGAFSFLLNRAAQWSNISSAIVQPQYATTLDFVALSGIIQLGWDRFEGHNFIRRAGDEPFPNTPPHQILFHVAKEDAQVNNLVSECLGRTAGAKLMTPAVRPVWGMEEVTGPVMEPFVYAEYDFGVPDNPRPNAPASEETDTHEDLRRLQEGQDQIWNFLTTGEVDHFCDQACDPD